MQFKRFRHWCIQCKIVSITVLTLIAMVAGLFLFILPYFKQNLMHEKEVATRHVVELAMGVIELQDAEVKAGKLPLEEAKKLASAQISKLRYEAKEYLWIHDLGTPVPKMIMHPTVPALNGKVLDDAKFNKATSLWEGNDGKPVSLSGKNLFVSMNEAVAKEGHGFVTYEWPKPKLGGGVTDELFTKLSYVKKYEPWGWVVGSGIYVDDVKKQIMVAMWTILGGTVLFAIACMVLAVSIGRGVTLPIKSLITSLEEMASGEGDLTRRISSSRDDETGRLAQSFNRFLDNLHGIISQVSGGTQQVRAASNRLHTTADHIADNSGEVASQASSVATAVEEMAATSQNIAQSCALAYDNANRACNTAQSGAEVVNAAVASIQAIADRVQETARMVESLGARSDQIGQIIGTIEDIADQTNLLALNAAIEAARAGEMGRGFAVVADEVRALAERTTRATKEIDTMIKVIQQETAKAVQAMEAGVEEVERGTSEAARSGDALREILSQISDVTSQLNQIATAAEEQTATTNDISSNMQRIVNVVEQTVESSRTTSSEATDLASMAGDLAAQVGKFRL
jgi:methyl-accepting chemotaxis protein